MEITPVSSPAKALSRLNLQSEETKRFSVNRLNLARLPWIRALIVSRWPLFIARALTVVGFVFTILIGFFGSPVGSQNFAIIFVWIAWWTALKLFFIPLGGRSWCSICPLPMPGEWLQQGGLISKSSRRLGLGLRWPRYLRGYWLQASLFLVIGLFSAVTLTNPRVTSWVLLGLVLLAIVLSLVFERRAFCSYLCPIGGFTGVYAKTAPVEVRVVNTAICATHSEKSCYIECPWGIYPVAQRDSSQCGLCMECLRVCPHDNIALNLRPFNSDLGTNHRSTRLDESFLALVMVGCAVAFSTVFTGPWGFLKNAALSIGSQEWFVYAVAFLMLNLVALPAAFVIAVWLGQKMSNHTISLRRAIANGSQVLLPLGLFGWIAFTISFALPKFSYVINAISDPFGWDWNLLGKTAVLVNADKLDVAPFLQIAALLVGLYGSIRTASRLAGAEGRQSRSLQTAFPLIAFSMLYTLLMMGLLVG
jgi:polyferredoxin